MYRYHILDALIAAALLAFTVACFQQGGFSAGLFLSTIVLGSGYLGYKTGMRHEADRNERDGQ